MALPGDISQPPAPGDSPRPAPGDPGDPREPGNSDQDRSDGQRDGTSEPGQEAGSLPGLPRLFFAAEPDLHAQPDSATTSYRQPGAPGLQVFGQPGEFGQPTGSGQPPGSHQPPQVGQPGGLAQRGRLGRPGQRPPARAVRPRPTRPPDRELRHRAIASLLLGVLSLVALLGLGGNLHRGVYLLIFSAAVGIAASVIGITAVVKARKTGSYRPRGAVGGIVLGTIAALLSIPILSVYLAFPRQVDNYVKCLTQSQSQSSGSQQACMNKFYKSIHLGAQVQGNSAAAQISAASGERRRPA
jgi:hypothetical protein